jgi:hypothetical protein
MGDKDKATDYGRLMVRKGHLVGVCKIRLYDGHEHNWYQRLVTGGVITIPTDQTYNLDANIDSRPYYYDEVWFDGIRIYKKPWYMKLISYLKE